MLWSVVTLRMVRDIGSDPSGSGRLQLVGFVLSWFGLRVKVRLGWAWVVVIWVRFLAITTWP